MNLIHVRISKGEFKGVYHSMEGEQPPAARSSPMLEQDPITKNWRGEDDEYAVILSDQAFQSYVDAYLELRHHSEDSTVVFTEQQRRTAEQAVQRLTYWHHYMGYETDVHVRRFQPSKGGDVHAC